jgi:hypothetical protein
MERGTGTVDQGDDAIKRIHPSPPPRCGVDVLQRRAKDELIRFDVLQRRTKDELICFAESDLCIEVVYRQLNDLTSFFFADPRQPGRRLLTVNAGATEEEQIVAITQAAAHVLLGHMEDPFKIILEPRAGYEARVTLKSEDADERDQATWLARIILWGCNGQTRADVEGDGGIRRGALDVAVAMSKLLPGSRHRSLRVALKYGLTRKVISQGLKAARNAYLCTDIGRHRVVAEALTDVREMFCLTQIVVTKPELAAP